MHKANVKTALQKGRFRVHLQIRQMKSMKKITTIFALILAAVLLPAAALASGETYYWQDAGHTSIVGQSGSYKSPAAFTQASQDANQTVYTTNFDCSGTTTEIRLTIQAADLTKDPAPGTVDSSCSSANIDAAAAIAKDAASAAPTTASKGSKCDQGIMSWLMCPILTKIEETISSIATTMLQPLLHINAVSPSNTPGLYKVWTNFRSLANVLFVLIFIVAIFANTLSIGLDHYTIKKMLPRLVAAAVLVQFSFIITSLLVDTGNVLGGGVQGLILGLSNGTSSAKDWGNLFENLVIGGVSGVALVALTIASWPLILPLLASLLIAVLAFFFTIGARLLLISVLIAVSPLAFVAWVLPNTESYFKKWWTMLLRLILMYPIIIAILSIAGQVNQLLAFSGDSANNGAAGLAIDALRPIIFIYAFTLIPKTFKWAGGIMAGAQNYFNNIAGGRQKALRESQWYKDRQNRRRDEQVRRMNQLASSRPITSLTTSRSRMMRRAGGITLGGAAVAMGGAPSTSLGRARAFSGNLSTYAQEMEDLPEVQVPTLLDGVKAAYDPDNNERRLARARLAQNAPALLQYLDTAAGRAAMIKRLDADNMVNRKTMNNIMRTAPEEYGTALQAAASSFPKKPALLSRFALGELDENNRAHPVGDLKADVLGNVIGGLTAAKIRDDLHQENFEIAQDERAVAAVMADKLSSQHIAANFEEGRQTYMDSNKRREVIKMIKAQHDLFQAGKGAELKEAVLSQLATNEASFLDEFVAEAGVSPYMVPTNDLKVDVIRDWLNRP